jgi:L-rhamnonate dehydratase
MSKIVKIQWGYLTGKRLRHAGSNARLGEHGRDIRESYAKITLDDGVTGFGYSRINPQQAESLLGKSLDELITLENGVSEQFRFLDFALWDVFACREGKPLYALLNPTLDGRKMFTGETGLAPTETYFRVPCYDTSLYIDDLHLNDDNAAAELVAGHARQGYERGHRAFKIKVGRGAMHIPLEAGNRRDIAVIRAVRAAVGADCKVMIDANNGYNFNISKYVLSETADCNLYWLEEAFHEDNVLYKHLHQWMDDTGLTVLLADGEGHAAPDLMAWARDKIVDVVQYDIRQYGFSRWLEFARQLDAWGVLSAPHNYGSAFGEYASCHLAAAIQHFAFVESDVIHMDGLDAAGYALDNGMIQIPDSPGFGLTLDESALMDGFTVSL